MSAATPLGFILQFPWGLYDEGARARISQDHVNGTPASGAATLALEGTVTPRVEGSRLQPLRETEPFSWGTGSLAMWSLPAGDSRGTLEYDLTIADRGSGRWPTRLEITGATSRESRPTSEGGAAARGLDLDSLVGALVELLQTTMDRGKGDVHRTGALLRQVRVDWDIARDVWLAERDEDEPRKPLIVRHAETLSSSIVRLATHPRRLLARRRELLRIHRIQEMDSACLSWYVRQPGGTAAEKGGVKQVLLGIAREESLDTPENRILRDFLERTVREANTYRLANRRVADGERYRLVSRYGSVCRSLLSRAEIQRIGRLVGLPRPNYVLQHDSRYRQMWEAYQQLIRREEQVDQAWAWQRRLWVEFVHLFVHVALLELPGCKTLARSPAYYRVEQDAGRWVVPTAQTCAFRLDSRSGEVRVLSPLNIQAPGSDPVLRQTFGPLGLHTVVRVTNPRTRRMGEIAVWAQHGVGEDMIALDQSTGSAGRALYEFQRARERETGYAPNVVGLVVQPTSTLYDEPSGVDELPVKGLAVPLSGGGFLDAVDQAGSILRDLAVSVA